jgi:hypothetical protein
VAFKLDADLRAVDVAELLAARLIVRQHRVHPGVHGGHGRLRQRPGFSSAAPRKMRRPGASFLRMSRPQLHFGDTLRAANVVSSQSAFYERTLRVGYCNLTNTRLTRKAKPITEYLHVLAFIPRLTFVPYDDSSYPLVDGTPLDMIVMLPFLRGCREHPTVRNATWLRDVHAPVAAVAYAILGAALSYML